MPVAIPLVGLAVSAGVSGVQMAQANKQRKAAQKAIEDYKRPELANAYNGLQVSTLGADRQREDMARTLATYGGMAAMGGSRGIAATLPALLEQQNAQEAQIAANLDQQQMQINQLQAGGEMQVQGMQEQRGNNDLLGYGNLLNNANQERAGALNQLATTGASFGLAAANGLLAGSGGSGLGKTPSDVGFKTTLPGGTAERIATTSPIIPNPNLNNALITAGGLSQISPMMGMGAFGNILPYMGYQNPQNINASLYSNKDPRYS